ncbi:MAG TPA: DUF5985 family protein [Longimicrobiaceae bacterium]|nr:DUF5985 family protein [Longimicrobiaceae bacterium]
MTSVVAGALAMGYFVACLYFLKFWRDLRDRLFLLFAVAFALLAVQRVALALVAGDPEAALPLYGLRLLAFVLIIVAIVDKNRSG